MMKTLFALFSLAAVLLTSQSAIARDDWLEFPIADVMAMPEAQEKLAGVRFYFGDQGHPGMIQKYGEFSTNKKTNAFNKSDQQACNWAMLSALIALHNRALKEGGNAVIGVKSNYKKVEFSSNKVYRCGAGKLLAGVALKGTVAKLK